MAIRVISRAASAKDAWVEENKSFLAERTIRMFNLIGSPGSGRTALLEATINELRGRARIGVIAGSPASTKDAERIQKTGAHVIQLNTGNGCYLEASLVRDALRELASGNQLDLVFIENVGNLVCPAQYDLGETGKIAVLSVTEGDDKVEKYPAVFSSAKAVVITKTRLLPCCNFRMEHARRAVQELNRCPVFAVDSLTAENFEPWLEFLGIKRSRPEMKKAPGQTPPKGKSRGDENNLDLLM